MGKNTSVALGNHFEQFVKEKIESGRFSNASEIIRAGLRLLEGEEQKFNALKAAVQEGIDSGIAEDYNPEEHLKSLKLQRQKNA